VRVRSPVGVEHAGTGSRVFIHGIHRRREQRAAPSPKSTRVRTAACWGKCAVLADEQSAACPPGRGAYADPRRRPPQLCPRWLAEERQATLLSLTSRLARLHQLLGGEYPALFPASPAAPAAASAAPASGHVLDAGGRRPTAAEAVNGAGSSAAAPTVGAAVGVGSTDTASGAPAHEHQPAAEGGHLPEAASALSSPFWTQAALAAAAPPTHAPPPLPPNAPAPIELSLFREARARWGLAPPASAAPEVETVVSAASGGTPPHEPVAGVDVDGNDGTCPQRRLWQPWGHFLVSNWLQLPSSSWVS
jgi:hypothetical protein